MTSDVPIDNHRLRQAELDALAAAFVGDARVLTLVGAVGVGKSWLAAAGARAALDARVFESVLTLDLAGASTLESVLARAVSALSLASQEAVDLPRERRRIAAAIEERGQALVVLDDADDALDVLRAGLLDELRSATEARFLVTSRAPLGLAGERVIEVSPLAVPRDSELDGAAASFFLDRVRRRQATYSPAPGEAGLLAELVRELDGLPLAMELAAPRLAVMGAAALLHRLRTSRSVLRARPGAAAPRQGSFDKALEGSWQALQAWERDALAALTAFASFELDDAEAALDLKHHAAAPPVLDVLEALRDRSLLASAGRGEAGEVRLRLLGSVADFVRRRADPTVLETARERHALRYGELARHLCKELDGPRSRAALARIDRERDNLLLAIRRALVAAPVTVREAEPALWALLALAPGLEPHPALAAHAQLLERVLDATQNSGADPTLLGRAFGLRGAFRRRAGDLAGAARDLGRALRLAQTLGAQELEGVTRGELALVVEASGDLEGATAEARSAVERLGALGARAEEARALLVLARLEAANGHAKSSKALAMRALALSEARGLEREELRARLAVARASIDLGAPDEARAQSVRARAAGDQAANVVCDELDGLCYQEAGDLKAASSSYAAAASGARAMGLVGEEARALVLSAIAAIERRSLAEAYAHLSVAADVAKGSELGLVQALLASVARLDTEAGQAAPPATTAPVAPLDRAVALFLTNAATDSKAARETLLAVWSESAFARLLARALERASATSDKPAALPKDALVVGAAGRWFCTPGAEAVSLERRRPLAALLERLASARSQQPGVAVSWSEMLAAAWPGERMIAATGAHRVRVAISTLRKLGLKDLLVTTPEGYALGTSCPLHRAPDS